MRSLITIIHILASIMLIMVVLLQAGKGANMGAAFGGASQTVFGSAGPGSFLGKLTTVIAAVFMLTSLSLSYFSIARAPSLMDKVPVKTAPVVPAKPISPDSKAVPQGEKK